MKAVLQAVQVLGNGTPLPRLPKRQGDVKGKQAAEDLLKLFTMIDECTLIIFSRQKTGEQGTVHFLDLWQKICPEYFLSLVILLTF